MRTALRGLPSFDSPGPVTVLRILGRGIEVPLDPDQASVRVGRQGPPVADVQLPYLSVAEVHAVLTRMDSSLLIESAGETCAIARAASRGNWRAYVPAERFLVNVGDRFTIGNVGLLALDERTNQVAPALMEFCGPDRHDEVDRALAATTWSRMIWLRAGRGSKELVTALHGHSFRRGYPIVVLGAEPPAADIDELCIRAGCGVLVIDLTKRWDVPVLLTANLFSPRFHLWTIVVASNLDDILSSFGTAWHQRPSACGFEIVGF